MKGSKELIEHYNKRKEELGEKATRLVMYLEGYAEGYKDTKAVDHSEEHLNWIVKQHHLWTYEMCHCDNNDQCTFKEWIDKAMEE